MQVVIPSKSRVRECRHALKLFPSAIVVVNETQLDDYRQVGAELLAHPKDLFGIGPLKNWILDNVPGDIFIVDDDVRHLRSPVGETTNSHVIRDPEIIAGIIRNTAEIARGIDAPVFGYDQSGGDSRKYRGQDPLRFHGWVGAAMGFVGRHPEVRYDENLRTRADIDFCLTAMLKKRVIVIDGRYSFIHHKRWTHPGGNASTRSGKRNQEELFYLKNKWGKWITIKESPGGTTMRIVLNVTRRW